jgi:thioesterase domain-containing protein
VAAFQQLATLGWPDDPATVKEAFEHPEVFAHKKVQAVTDHYLAAIKQLTKKPAVVGHSFGGLIAQKIAGSGVSAATVSIDNAPFRDCKGRRRFARAQRAQAMLR